MEKLTYAVITKINSIKGNLYNPTIYKSDGTEWMEVMRMSFKEDNCSTGPLVEAFVVGEICVLNEHGREVNGMQRKPGKWNIEVEEFSTFDAALKRAIEVTAKY